jgi:hypothetical protein
MATSFSGGRSRREPPTMGKQLVNFITCGCEIECTLFCNLQSRARTHIVLVIGLCFAFWLLAFTILEEEIKYERFKLATYVAEFVILNEIVDFRDICEGSTDGTFVINHDRGYLLGREGIANNYIRKWRIFHSIYLGCL